MIPKMNLDYDDAQPIISIQGLCTSICGQTIHEDLDLEINKGEIFAVVGGSGAGKTTLLRAILMLLSVAKGTIKVFGHDISRSTVAIQQLIRRHWGVMFQHGALFSSLTVLENIAFPLKEQTDLSEQSINEIARLKISMAGLSSEAAYKYPSELSGGMQKRAAIARSIALDPELLFLDEPTAGLDPQGASALDELVLNLKANLGLTIVIVTHDLDTLWRVTDRVAFLGEKKVLQVAPMEELNASTIPLVKDYFSDPRSQVARNILSLSEEKK